MFGTLQKRLPQELRLAGIGGIEEANRFLKEVYLPQHNARFQVTPEADGSAFVPFAGALDDILCIQEERTRLERQHRALQAPPPAAPRRPPPPPLRQGHGQGARASRRHVGRLPRPPMPGPIPGHGRAHRHPNPAGRVSRFDATGQGPVDKWTAAPRLTHFPTGQPQQQKRSTHLVHKPVNSECARQYLSGYRKILVTGRLAASLHYGSSMHWADGSRCRTSTEGSPMRQLPALAGTVLFGVQL